MKQVNRLFVRTFGVYFLGFVVLIVLLLIAAGRIKIFYSISLREQTFIASYTVAFSSLYDSTKSKQSIQHLIKNIKHKDGTTMYFLSEKDGIIGKKPFPPEVKSINWQFRNNSLPDITSKQGNYLISGNAALYELHNYRLVVDSSDPLYKYKPLMNIIINMLLALTGAALCSYFFSRSLTRPLLVIQKAVHAIAQGKLNTRIGGSFKNRYDELSTLGEEFDIMVDELDSLVSSKERLLEDISHELRAPLLRQRVALELIGHTKSREENKNLNRITFENMRLSILIDEILSLAKLNTHRRKLNIETVDLLDLINTIVNDANYEFQSEVIHFKTSEDIKLKVDRLLIHRAIENVVRNALFYSPAHNKVVNIQLEVSNNKVIITVSDNGPGVDNKELKRIFDVFYRANTDDKQQLGGYGLGLAISKQAIRLHKGTIAARNKKTGGLEVFITLPYEA